jgi:plastocyanin domain-containing protein
MNTIQILVSLSGVGISLFIIWFFWLAPKEKTIVTASNGGVQEVSITVKGGYTPDIIVVKAGRPLRMRFTRQEGSSCTEMVLFPEFNLNAKLPEGQEVALEFTPEEPGEFGFQCQMGMIRGKLIVE